MNVAKYIKYILYITLVIVFVFIRANFIFSNQGISETDFEGIAILSCSWPFNILKECVLKEHCMPLYYLIGHVVYAIFKTDIALRILNSIFSLITTFLLLKIGKKLYSRYFGFFLAFVFVFNHYFLFYSNQITSFSLDIMMGSILILCLINFLDNQTKKYYSRLNIINIIYILTSPFGALFVLAELIILFFRLKKQTEKKLIIRLAFHSFIAYLFVFPIVIIQYAIASRLLILNNIDGIGFNFSGLYILLSDFLSRYLSFNAPEYQQKSILGMIYTFVLNPDILNINSLKIFITLFYVSILPLFMLVFFTYVSYSKNKKLKNLFLISILFFSFYISLVIFEKYDLSSEYLGLFYLILLILLGYGIFNLKDKTLQIIIIASFFLVQFINPNFKSFDITIKKNSYAASSIDMFIEDYSINSNDIIFIPHIQKYAKNYYKKLTFFNFDYSMLQSNNKSKIVKNINNRKANTINKNNYYFLMQDYLKENHINQFISSYFIKNLPIDNYDFSRIIVVVDKINFKPISISSIEKIASFDDYSFKRRKIDFKYKGLENSQSKQFFDALKSKTFYNFLNLIASNYHLVDVVEYKKIDNEFYRIPTDKKNPTKSLVTPDSDYVFMIFND